MNKKTIVKEYMDTVIKTCEQLNQEELCEIYDILMHTAECGGKIYICGNGGSASTASHFQTDLNKAFSISREKMPAVCLSDNISTLTATANDYSYDEVFSYQLKYIMNTYDILIAISCSGNSENVLKAAEYARARGNTVISLVGFDGGKLKAVSDYCFHVPLDNMQISEDMHMLFCHLVSTMVRESKERQ